MLMYCDVHKNKGKPNFNWKKINCNRYSTNRIVGGGNRGAADKPYQNQIEFLMGASFSGFCYASTLFCTGVWIKPVALKKGT